MGARGKRSSLILCFAGGFHRGAKIDNEPPVLAFARFLVGLSKQRGWVNRGKDAWRKLGRQHFAALARNAERRPEDRLSRGRPEADQ